MSSPSISLEQIKSLLNIDIQAEQTNRKVIGLWAINQDRNAWVYIENLGWRRISPDNDVIFYNMLAQLISAKAANRPVNFQEENNVIKQVYVL